MAPFQNLQFLHGGRTKRIQDLLLLEKLFEFQGVEQITSKFQVNLYGHFSVLGRPWH
jgi:hypothetical protein